MPSAPRHAGRFASFRHALGRPLRVGGIDYLNSRPLIECFEMVAGEEVELGNHPPSELARKLRAGELDVALVPVVEYFLSPRRCDYWIVPGIGISSYGAVESIRLYHRTPLGEASRVALDSTSMTSQLLTRLFFAERPSPLWRGRGDPVFNSTPPQEIVSFIGGDDAAGVDAALLIGDSALRASPGPGWRFVDLGLEWTRWLGLPFVYAFWVFHGTPIEGLADCFRIVRHEGLARIDAIVDRGPLPSGMSRHHCLRYLSQVIRYGLGPAEIEGILEFSRRLRDHGLLDAAGDGESPRLRFLGE